MLKSNPKILLIYVTTQGVTHIYGFTKYFLLKYIQHLKWGVIWTW